MSKSYVVAMACVLSCVGMAAGQAPTTPPPPPPSPPPFQLPVQDCGACAPSACCMERDIGCATRGMFTADAEYVFWFVGRSRISSALEATNELRFNSAILDHLTDTAHDSRTPIPGGRFSVGYWQAVENPWVVGGIREWGVEATAFFVGERSFSKDISTAPDLVRPFYNVNQNREDEFIVAAPGLASGRIVTSARADLWGAEVNGWKNLTHDSPGTTFSIDILAGFRYLDLNQDLEVDSASVFRDTITAPFLRFASFAGNTLQVTDSFSTRNRFYGGQVGVSGKLWAEPCLLFEGSLKLAVGETQQDLDIGGHQIRTLANGTVIASNGGVLALPSNSGSYRINRFGQIPEASAKITVPVTSCFTVSIGFNALYWSRILRPGLQIDREVDITQLPNFPHSPTVTPTGLGVPSVPFTQASLKLFGFTLGTEFTW